MQGDALRAAMVEEVLRTGCTRSADVERVLRRVPRHAFLPGTPLEKAYDPYAAVVTKRDADGAARSSASAPSIVATMLDQLAARPGHRVLEIGAGTGYNAALLAELVGAGGAGGAVTTVDIDGAVAAQARRALHVTGHGRVRVRTGDGYLGWAEHSPYDRILVTAGAFDVPGPWFEQLVPGGRLVVPLRWRGQTHSVAFVREPQRLRSESMQVCGFIPMAGADGERLALLAPDVLLAYDSDQQEEGRGERRIDPAALVGVLDLSATHAWSGVTVGGDEPFTGIWLLLTVTEPTACFLTRGGGVRPPRTPAVVSGGSLAWLTYRRVGAEARVELGAEARGAAGPELAGRIVEQVHAWNRDRSAQPLLTAHPTGTPVRPGTVVVKQHVRLVLSA